MNEAVNRWRGLVTQLAAGIPVPILLGLMERTSNGDPQAQSQGAIGLYQIHEDTARAIGIDPAGLTDPTIAIQGAVTLLGDRARQIQAALLGAGAPMPGSADLWPLSLAAYWYGPRDILAAIQLGAVSKDQVFAQLLEKGARMRAFAADVLRRADQYSSDDRELTTEPAEKTGAGPGLAIAAGVAAVAIAAAIWGSDDR